MYFRYTNDVIASAAFGIKVDSLAEPNNLFYNMGKKVTNFGGLIKTIKFSVIILVPKLAEVRKI